MPSISKIAVTIIFLAGSLAALGTQFLSVPSSANMLAQGDQVAMATESLVNPALLSEISGGPQIDLSLGSWLADVKATSLNYKFDRAGTAANVQLRYMGINDLEFRDERPSDDPLANYSSYGAALDGGLARNLGSIRYGLKLRLVQIRIYDESSTGYALDLGAVKTIRPGFKVGFAALNLGQMNAMQVDDPLMPIRILAGTAFTVSHPVLPTELGLTGEWSSLVDGLIINFGSCSRWKNSALIMGTTLAPDVVEVSAGFNISIGRYTFGYGVQIGSQDLGLPQILDLSVQLP